jgi:hypothetical protein
MSEDSSGPHAACRDLPLRLSPDQTHAEDDEFTVKRLPGRESDLAMGRARSTSQPSTRRPAWLTSKARVTDKAPDLCSS